MSPPLQTPSQSEAVANKLVWWILGGAVGLAAALGSLAYNGLAAQLGAIDRSLDDIKERVVRVETHVDIMRSTQQNAATSQTAIMGRLGVPVRVVEPEDENDSDKKTKEVRR